LLRRFRLNPHPGTDPHHDADFHVGDAIDAAARTRGHDRFGSGNSGLGAGDDRRDLGFPGAQLGQFRLGGIAIAKGGSPSSLRFRLRRGYGGQAAGQANFASAIGAASIFRRLRKIIVMGFLGGGRGTSRTLGLYAVTDAAFTTNFQPPQSARPAHRTAHRSDQQRWGLGKCECFFHAPSKKQTSRKMWEATAGNSR